MQQLVPPPVPQFTSYPAKRVDIRDGRAWSSGVEAVPLSIGDVVKASNDLLAIGHLAFVDIGEAATAWAHRGTEATRMRERILGWLRSYGPLGIDLLDVVELRSAVRIVGKQQPLRRVLHGNRALPVHVWLRGRWQTRQALSLDRPRTHRRIDGEIRTLADLAPAFCSDPSKLPGPQTAAFWRAYGEPVEAFAIIAASLYGAATRMTSRNADDQRAGLATVSRYAVTATVQTALEADGRALRPVQHVTAPTLLGLLAYQMTHAFTFGKMFICPRCGRPALKSRSRRRYCRSGCRAASWKEIDRGSVRAAKTLLAEGASEKQILSALGGTEAENVKALKRARWELRRSYSAVADREQSIGSAPE